MNICTYKMCNTYVCVLYHSSYMSSVTCMWISSIWLSKNILVDALKIHLTRSDSPLLRKTSIVFLPMCTDILIIFHQRVCHLNRLLCGGCSVSPQNSREKSSPKPNSDQVLTGGLWLTVGSSHSLHQWQKDPGGTEHQDQWVYVFSEPLPPLWHGGIFLLHKGRGKRGRGFKSPMRETFLSLFPLLHPTMKSLRKPW